MSRVSQSDEAASIASPSSSSASIPRDAASDSVEKRAHGSFKDYYSLRRQHRQQQQASSVATAASSLAGEGGAGHCDIRAQAFLIWYEEREEKAIKRILDVGCNEGIVGIQLAQRLDPSPDFLLGADLDEQAISAATANAQATQDSKSDCEMSFVCGEWTYADQSPSEVSAKIRSAESGGFDLIAALSITKWIHLHHLDTGLLRFFARLGGALAPGGLLLLEPQPFRSYEQARRSLPREKRARWNKMRLRTEDFAFVLGMIGFEEVGSSWDQVVEPLHLARPLMLLRKRDVSPDDSATQSIFRAVIASSIDDEKAQDDALRPDGPRHYPLPFPWVSRSPKDLGKRIEFAASRASVSSPSGHTIGQGKDDGIEAREEVLQFQPRKAAKKRRG